MTPDADADRDGTPLDLSALGPPLVADRWDAMVAGALRASEGELARRTRPSISRAVVAWRRPVLAVASLAMAAALVLIVVPQQRATRTSVEASRGSSQVASTVAESIGIPGDWAPRVEGSATTMPNRGSKAALP